MREMTDLEEWLRAAPKGFQRSARLEPNSCELSQYPYGVVAQGYGQFMTDAIGQALGVAAAREDVKK